MNVILKIIILTSAFLAAGCDPGLKIRPSQWDSVDAGMWQTSNFGLLIKVSEISGLIGQSYTNLSLVIKNNSSQSVTLKSVKIRRNQKNYPGVIKNRQAHIDVNKNFLGHFEFSFNEPLFEVFKSKTELVMLFSQNGNSFEVVAELENDI